MHFSGLTSNQSLHFGKPELERRRRQQASVSVGVAAGCRKATELTGPPVFESLCLIIM